MCWHIMERMEIKARILMFEDWRYHKTYHIIWALWVSNEHAIKDSIIESLKNTKEEWRNDGWHDMIKNFEILMGTKEMLQLDGKTCMDEEL